jgi:hypothetical protein
MRCYERLIVSYRALDRVWRCIGIDVLIFSMRRFLQSDCRRIWCRREQLLHESDGPLADAFHTVWTAVA